MPNSNDHLIKHINLKLNTSEKCPLCNNTIRIDIRDEAQKNLLMGTLKSGYHEYEKRAIRFSTLKDFRRNFWVHLVLLVVYSLFALLKIDPFHILSMMTLWSGIGYVVFYIVQRVLEKKIEKKVLHNEIDEIIK